MTANASVDCAGAPVLSVQGLSLAREGRIFARLSDFQVLPGRSLAVVGRSGSGKTTALMALAAVRAPATGTIEIGGINPWSLQRAARDRFRNCCIGLVFQSFHLVDALSVAANIRLPARCASRLVDSRIAAWLADHPVDEGERLDLLLKALGLVEISGHRADRISQGQAQRAAVARALFNRPAVILADEPTSALDDDNASALLDLLRTSAVSENAALVIATHDRRALQAVDHVLAIESV
ncbi:MAG TPA: ATP-binding cassette domain-containing protein [Rhizomicrobium sp.]|nr:ATP-binding cassette domain-containing protein [Rhizomicrobium sp.]